MEHCSCPMSRVTSSVGLKKSLLLVLLVVFVSQSVHARPFFNSRFYTDEHRMDWHRNTNFEHFGERPRNFVDDRRDPVELKFVSFGRDRRTPIENKIELNPSSSNDLGSKYGDFFLRHLWDDGLRDRTRDRTQFVVYREKKQRRKRVSHGILGLWG